MRAVALAVRFTSQEGLFDAERLSRRFGGGLRSAAGRADQHDELEWIKNKKKKQKELKN